MSDEIQSEHLNSMKMQNGEELKEGLRERKRDRTKLCNYVIYSKR